LAALINGNTHEGLSEQGYQSVNALLTVSQNASFLVEKLPETIGSGALETAGRLNRVRRFHLILTQPDRLLSGAIWQGNPDSRPVIAVD
jgi:hypothetical protein